MRILMRFDFDDDARERIAVYEVARFGKKRVARLATREQCRAFILEAMDNQNLALADTLSVDEAWERGES